jgi:hypothetical protein
MFAVAPLSIQSVYRKFKEIALLQGASVITRKLPETKDLFLVATEKERYDKIITCRL